MPEPTIRDVARRAQLSVATVSRALNGFQNVSESAREKVATAAQQLGYVPHAGARSLSLAHTNALGVVLPALHGEFFSEIVRGMDEVASRHGYFLLMTNVHRDAPGSNLVLRAMRGRVDGLLLMAPHVNEQELVDALPQGLPTLLINTRAPSAQRPGIHLDNAAGAAMVGEHFLRAGRRKLVHITGPRGNIDAQERANTFAKVIASEPGATLEIVEGDFYEESGSRAVEQLLARGIEFDAIFAANDNMAIGALQALQSAGRRVPDDVLVAGFDDIPQAAHLGLTTVRVQIAELGKRAITRLLAVLAGGEDNRDELHKPELVIRSTSQA